MYCLNWPKWLWKNHFNQINFGNGFPDKGTIEFNGKSVLGEHLYRENIGYMPQIGRYPDNMTIGQIIEMIKKIRNSNQALDEDLLKAFKSKVCSTNKCELYRAEPRKK
jgi:ABC-type multidrug transport system ATPase subunit